VVYETGPSIVSKGTTLPWGNFNDHTFGEECRDHRPGLPIWYNSDWDSGMFSAIYGIWDGCENRDAPTIAILMEQNHVKINQNNFEPFDSRPNMAFSPGNVTRKIGIQLAQEPFCSLLALNPYKSWSAEI
jgi:hypothetical protein